MTMPPPPPGARVLRVAALLVPRCLRDDWREEWEAELGHAWDARDPAGPALFLRFLLVWRVLGAFPDALELRGASGGELMLMRDLRFALRTLARRPSFTALVVLTLGLGIGASTAVFTVVDGVLLRPLPYREPDRIVELWAGASMDDASAYLRPAFVEAWREQRALFAAVAHYGGGGAVLYGNEPRSVRTTLASGDFFGVLGMPPQHGRLFTPEEGDHGAAVAVISDRLWRTEFGADPDVLGRLVTIDSTRYTVIGVMPPTFRYPIGEPDVWMPLGRGPQPDDQSALQAIARLAPPVHPDAAQAMATEVATRLAAERPDGKWQLALRPISEWRANDDIRHGLLVLSAAVTLVLLIACVNAANLLLVHATGRRRELVVRLALGATRWRVIRELLAEALLLAAASGALGLALAYGGVQVILALAPAELTLFSLTVVEMDARVYGFALAASALTGVLFGVLPAVQASRGRASLATAERAGTATTEQRRVRALLVVGELALSMMLLVGAGLLLHSFVRLSSVDAGMDVDRLAVAELTPLETRYPDAAARREFYGAVLQRIRAIPGVQDAVVAGGTAISFGLRVEAEGAAAPLTEQPLILPHQRADSTFFRVAGIPFRQGRPFQESDYAADANTVIVDEALARALWPDGRALGRRFRLDAKDPWLTVVGVVADVRLFGPDDRQGRFDLFHPGTLGDGGHRPIMVRTAGDPARVLPEIKAAIHAVDVEQPIHRLQTARERFHTRLAKPRFLLALMLAFAAVAAGLAGIGLYGVIAFGVAQRTREIGIRVALGARAAQITGQVLGQGIGLALAGVVLGIAGALALTRLLGSLLYDVSPGDPLTIAAVAVVLGTVALLASWIPARRASRVDPVEALRAE